MRRQLLKRRTRVNEDKRTQVQLPSAQVQLALEHLVQPPMMSESRCFVVGWFVGCDTSGLM